MSVQPLKSIAFAGLAVGASGYEIRAAAVGLGLIFIASLRFDLESWAKQVPIKLIHGVQVGLGFVLVQQGYKHVMSYGLEFILLAGVSVALIIYLTYKFQYPILGVVSSMGFFSSLFWLEKIDLPSGNVSLNLESFRPFLILSLVLPQIILTSANSVLATANVSRQLFGKEAERVNVRRLISLMGFGNVLSGLLGGLPFCHGSGGVTAHHKGGARTNRSNYFIGTSLLFAALASFIFGNARVTFSPLLLSVLLLAVGFMHVVLAAPSWSQGKIIKLELALMGLAALFSGNMLWVLGVGIIFEVFTKGVLLFLERRQHDTI
jgi:hypothetical protein